MNTDKIYAEHIVNEYSKKKDSKVLALKKIDQKVKRGPTVFAYTFGIAFSLVLGVGMCLSMNVFNLSDVLAYGIGIPVGALGVLGVSINHFIYAKWLGHNKEKYAGDIIRMAKEIVEEDEQRNE